MGTLSFIRNQNFYFNSFVTLYPTTRLSRNFSLYQKNRSSFHNSTCLYFFCSLESAIPIKIFFDFILYGNCAFPYVLFFLFCFNPSRWILPHADSRFFREAVPREPHIRKPVTAAFARRAVYTWDRFRDRGWNKRVSPVPA